MEGRTRRANPAPGECCDSVRIEASVSLTVRAFIVTLIVMSMLEQLSLAEAKAHLSEVVEGVETESQLGHLQGLGCSVAQGYLFARPMPASSLEDLFCAASDHRLGRVPAPGRLNVGRAPSAVRLLPDLAAVDDALHRRATVGIA